VLANFKPHTHGTVLNDDGDRCYFDFCLVLVHFGGLLSNYTISFSDQLSLASFRYSYVVIVTEDTFRQSVRNKCVTFEFLSQDYNKNSSRSYVIFPTFMSSSSLLLVSCLCSLCSDSYFRHFSEAFSVFRNLQYSV